MTYQERFVNGKGRYLDDIDLDGMLYMSLVRSPYARAKVKKVEGGLTSKDLKAYYALAEGDHKEPVLAIDEVNYQGQAVAAVFGKNRYESEDLLSTVNVEYEPMDAIHSIDDAKTKPPMYKDTAGNVLSQEDIGVKFNEKDIQYDVKVTDTILLDRVSANPMETRGIVADYRDGILNVYLPSQSIVRSKSGIVNSLGLPPEKVRVFLIDNGGAFGVKALFYPEYIIACYASMKYGKPVKWQETRTEHLQACHAGRGVEGTLTLYAKKDGTITGLDGEVLLDNGPYFVDAASVDLGNVIHEITGPYFIEKAHIVGKYMLTNKAPNGYYRGAGKPEASILMERMMDLLADKLNMDIADVRLKNALEKPFKSPLGLDVNYPTKPFLEDALKYFNYRELSKKEHVGISLFILDEDTAPGESARIIVKDGKVHTYMGGNVSGQGHEMFVKSILSDELSVEQDLISLDLQDTETLSTGVGTWGSKSAMTHGSVLMQAAEELKQQVKEKYGKYSPEILLKHDFDQTSFYKFDYNDNQVNFNLVTSKINEAGDIESLKVGCYYDLGKVLNMTNVMGQTEGGALQAIGEVLSETLRYSEEGQLMTTSITDAGVLTAEHTPEFDIKIVENPSVLKDGAKGLGESPMIGIPEGLARSLETQLHTRINVMPITREFLSRNL
ncbi:xanthine dehydrogenase family protein molybdopterin-binding subunit [Ferroplasma acidiphilum]|jgi:carbon-monoxide dehydrogenase large subunit|uniref:Carbon monoxide dehydrogenase beta subunit n=1 Tax=Ferroplasma acidiphilum TaxID=74969 RepID=A0A1V0N335_9ARCH|nr:xanthine dehydrogenase family protein molybdopterin-binding subunit [Ferroplasma acidiphilum]ARD84563.1 carbon monoxide dehydrogenase beta subunit [Ferroplasma acidiphilum]NOL59927.1 xanthine dehydrogenase family protein molybdopterin-binding subunit [Ferroplasma acidiphilum]